MKEGNLRNSVLVVSFALLPLLLMSDSGFVELGESGSGGPGGKSGGLSESGSGGPGEKSGGPGGKSGGPVELRPLNRLEDCLKQYELWERPEAKRLRDRIEYYKKLVINTMGERQGKFGSLKKHDRVTEQCLSGEGTRHDLLNILGLHEDEHGLRDPIVDGVCAALVTLVPASEDGLFAARDRFREKILRRLVGPKESQGLPFVPLCGIRTRFDGQHFKKFEEVERAIAGWHHSLD